MAPSSAAPENRPPFEDVLAHLPISNTTEYRKGQIIYGPDQPSTDIYLVASGKVKLSRISEEGGEVLLEIMRTDELFGQSGFLTVPNRSEQATALENSKVMTWPISAMEDLVAKRPRLAVALLQIFAQRNAEFALRIASFSLDNIQRRLARSLIHLCERLGTPEENGSFRMMPFTHELLAQHIGTSREIVTLYMNQFRKDGYLRYSRQEITVYRDVLAAAIVGTTHSRTVIDRADAQDTVEVKAAATATEPS